MNKNIKVKFDLSWFKECGVDLTGNFARNFDLLKAFHNLQLDVATDNEVKFYKKHFKLKDLDFKNYNAPLYLGEYHFDYDLFKNLKEGLINNFNPKLDIENQNMYEKINNSNACAVHVRRGDLSEGNPAYGEPINVDYFVKAINYVKNIQPNSKFFFFSDEIDYIKSDILPNLSDVDYEIVSINGSDKGYLDLFLMSKCNNFISSLGSLAKFAYFLSENKLEDTIFIASKNDKTFVLKAIKNIIYEDRFI